MLSTFSQEAIDAMATKEILYHLHHRGIPVSYYETFPALAEFFTILSTNTFDNVPIVSTAEAKNYPIYVTQYHPEIVYEPAPDINSDKSEHAYLIAKEFAEFMRDELLKSNHKFNS